MQKEEAKHLAAKLKAEFERLSKSGQSATERWARANPAMMRPRYLAMILKQAWDSIESRAERDLKARTATLASMGPRQRQIADIATKSEALGNLLGSGWTPPARRKDWPEIREKLAGELEHKGLTPEQIESELTNLEALNRNSISKAIGDTLDSSTGHLDFLAERNLTCFMGAEFALAVSHFNKALTLEPLPVPSAKTITSLATELLAFEQEVWQALKDEDLTLAAQAARNLAEWASELLDEMTKHAAAIAGKRKQNPTNMDDGQLALQIGDIIRGLLLAVALGKRVAWLAGWGPSLDPTRRWLQAAGRLSFMPTYKPPQEVSIATLVADSTTFDGKEVSAQGVLGPVTIVHRGKKVVSSAAISDPDGKSISVVLPYIKLDSGGLVGGAYSKISGIWQANSKEINGPALQIDLRNFEAESKMSWLAWAEMSLRPVIQVVPHQLAAGWSWESGSDGAGNGLRYGIWFVEREVKHA